MQPGMGNGVCRIFVMTVFSTVIFAAQGTASPSSNLKESIDRNSSRRIKELFAKNSHSGVDINGILENGDFPLHYAIFHSKEHSAKALLKNPQIDLKLRNRTGNLPLDVAYLKWQLEKTEQSKRILTLVIQSLLSSDQRGKWIHRRYRNNKSLKDILEELQDVELLAAYHHTSQQFDSILFQLKRELKESQLGKATLFRLDTPGTALASGKFKEDPEFGLLRTAIFELTRNLGFTEVSETHELFHKTLIESEEYPLDMRPRSSSSSSPRNSGLLKTLGRNSRGSLHGGSHSLGIGDALSPDLSPPSSTKNSPARGGAHSVEFAPLSSELAKRYEIAINDYLASLSHLMKFAPPSLKSFFQGLEKIIADRFPDEPEFAKQRALSFFFLRMICPQMIAAQLTYSDQPKMKLGILRSIKLLQRFIEQAGESKEEWMTPLIPFITGDTNEAPRAKAAQSALDSIYLSLTSDLNSDAAADAALSGQPALPSVQQHSLLHN